MEQHERRCAVPGSPRSPRSRTERRDSQQSTEAPNRRSVRRSRPRGQHQISNYRIIPPPERAAQLRANARCLGRAEGGRPKQPRCGLPPSSVVTRCRAAELPGHARDGLDRRRGSRGTRTRCTRGGTRTRRTRGNPRRTRHDLLSRRSHRGRSTSVITGVLRVTGTGVFAASTPPLGSGVAVRMHIAVGVRVGGRRSRRHRHPAHRYGQCCCRHQTDNRFSHLFPLSTCLFRAFERRWFRPCYTIWTSRPLPPFGIADQDSGPRASLPVPHSPCRRRTGFRQVATHAPWHPGQRDERSGNRTPPRAEGRE